MQIRLNGVMFIISKTGKEGRVRIMYGMVIECDGCYTVEMPTSHCETEMSGHVVRY